MSKKPKKTVKKQSAKASLVTYVNHAQDFFATHAVMIVIVLGGAAIGYSLYRARTYLNPVRDESRYSDGSAKLNYSKIDDNVLGRLKLTQNDKDNNVNRSLVPNRSNPFNE